MSDVVPVVKFHRLEVIGRIIPPYDKVTGWGLIFDRLGDVDGYYFCLPVGDAIVRFVLELHARGCDEDADGVISRSRFKSLEEPVDGRTLLPVRNLSKLVFYPPHYTWATHAYPEQRLQKAQTLKNEMDVVV